MSQAELFAIDSPCVSVCQTAGSGYCIGCLRNRHERFNWHNFSDEEKHRVLGLLARRRQKLDKLAQQKPPSQLSIFAENWIQDEFEGLEEHE